MMNPRHNTIITDVGGGMSPYDRRMQAQAQGASFGLGMAGLTNGSLQQARMYDPHSDSYIINGQKISARAFLTEETKIKTKEKSMLSEFKSDIKTFFSQHKGLIYTIVSVYLIDHFMFEGKFKAKLSEIIHKVIGNLEKKVDQIGAATDDKK